MFSEDTFSKYLQKLRKSLDKKLNEKSSDLYPFERTYEDNPNAVGRQETSNSKSSFIGLDEALNNYNGQLLILGEPGGGKTISLIEFAIKKVDERLNNQNSLLPIFVENYTWTEFYNHQKETSQDIIINWLAEQTKIERESLQRKIREHKALLLLDGLDELPFNVSENSQEPNSTREDYRAKFIESLKSLDDFQQVSMVVTCRRRDYEEITGNNDASKLDLNGAVVLNRLSEEEIEKYLNGKEEYGKLVWNLLKNSPDLLKIVRTPFLLDTLVSIYKYREGDRQAEQFPKVGNREQLFDHFIEQGFRREKEKKEEISQQKLPCSSSEELKDKLGEIAIVMMSDSKPDDNEIGEEILNRVIPQEKIWAFIELARSIQLLFNTSEENIYCFRHLLLRDYFAFLYANKFLQKGCVQDNNSISKIQVVRSLGKLDNQRAIELLTGILNNQEEDKDVRYEAANSLGQFSSRVYFQGYRQTFGNEHVISYSLREFSQQQTQDYFQESVPERSLELKDVIKIDRFSRGIPLVVNLAATMWREGIPLNDIVSKEGDSQAQIVATACERFLTHFSEFEYGEEDLRAVYILAMMRRFDSKFLQTMLRTTDLQSRGRELYNRYSFVSSELRLDGQHQFFFKKFLLKKPRNHSLVNEIGQQARIYLENCFNQVSKIRLTESLTISAELWINNPKNREIISDWIYYWFWKSEKEGWKYLIPYLVKGWFYNLDWAHSLLDIPSQFTSTRESSDLLHLFKWGLPPSENLTPATEDQSLLLDELEQRTNQILEDRECIAIILLKRGDLLFKQGKYREAEEKYKQLKSYIPAQAATLRNKLVSSEQRVEASIKKEDDIQNELLKVLKKMNENLTQVTVTSLPREHQSSDTQQQIKISDDSEKNLEEKTNSNYISENIQNPLKQPSEIIYPQYSNLLPLGIKSNYIFLGVGLLLFIVGFLSGVSISGNQNVLLWLFVGFLLGLMIGNDKIREALRGLYDQIKRIKMEEK